MTGRLETVLARDRWLVGGLLILVVLGSAWFILAGGGTGMSALNMTRITGPGGALIAGRPDMAMGSWHPGYYLVIFVMWWVMMMAMMLPSAAPVVLLYGALHRARGAGGMLEFAAGYLAIWGLFSILATLLQGGLVALGWMSAMYMSLTSHWLGAGVLAVAGLYQISPLKAACLSICRGPVEALTTHRRSGPLAAFRMGMAHGTVCLGCCWGLMALLFVGGVMNLWWIAGIAAMVAVEKLARHGQRLSIGLSAVFFLGAAVLAVSAMGQA